MSKPTDISKRQFLRGLSVVLGSTTAAQLLDGSGLSMAMAYSPTKDSASKNGKVFTQAQMQLLKSICDTVMPKTDTLAASEVDVHGFIDHQLASVYDKTKQQSSVQLLLQIDKTCLAQFKKPFVELTTVQQTQVLTSLEKREMGFTKTDKESFAFVKGLIVFGYFTSEYGATKVLKYLAIPGGFKGSVPYSSVGSSWGSISYY